MSQSRQSLPGATAGSKKAPSKGARELAPELLESTIPPTPLRELLAADGASVYVLTNDESLLATVQQAGGEQFPVYHAESWQVLTEAIKGRRCGIALLDVDAVHGDLTERLDELAKLTRVLVTLLASERQRAEDLIHLLSERKIHRLLIKPPTAGITRLLLESSISRYIELRQRPMLAEERIRGGAGRFAAWPSWLLAGALVAAVVAAVAFSGLVRPVGSGGGPAVPQVMRSVQPVEPVEPAPGPESALTLPLESEPFDSPQVSVSTAFATAEDPAGPAVLPAAEIVEPPLIEPSAAVTAAEPAGASADVDIDGLFTAAEQALIAEDLDAAADSLASIEALEPESSRLAFLKAQHERATARREADEEPADDAETARASPQPVAVTAAPPSELSSLVSIARARLAQDQVLSPPGDSALDYLKRARTLDPAAPSVIALGEQVGAAVVAAAQFEIDEINLDRAEALFAEAQALGVADEQLMGLELSLVYARDTLARAEENRMVALAQARLREGHLYVPEPDSALAHLLALERLNPDHPGLAPAFDALEAEISSEVEAALAAADWDRAEAGIGALERAGAAVGDPSVLAGKLEFGRNQQAFLAAAAPASELNVLEFEPPIYPDRALTRGIQGWVDLEFIVDTEGLPREVAVTGAEPEGEFENAALRAVSAYVYEPFERDARRYERRVSLRVRFALE
jgi:protein TonB